MKIINMIICIYIFSGIPLVCVWGCKLWWLCWLCQNWPEYGLSVAGAWYPPPKTFHWLFCSSPAKLASLASAHIMCVASFILSLCDIHCRLSQLAVNHQSVDQSHWTRVTDQTASCMKHEVKRADILSSVNPCFILCTAKLNWLPLLLFNLTAWRSC